jgi:Fic family protein
MGTYVDQYWAGDPTDATRAERTPRRFRAYVPHTLADRYLAVPASLAADLVDVETQVRRLNHEHAGLANLEPLARFLLRAEAVASSNIEGLVVNVRRLARDEAAAREGLASTDATARAVLGNLRALDEALSPLAQPTHRIEVADITRIHAALLRDTRDHRWAGQIRTQQNWVGGLTPASAAFVPPPAADVARLLDDLAAYLSSDDHPALMQAALAHSQFETIHPFADGNGRTGRALVQLVLRRRGVATTVVPPVSLVLAADASRYIAGLDATRVDGPDDEPHLAWISHFVDATARATRDASDFAASLVELERTWRSSLGRVRAHSSTDLLVSALAELPVFSVSTAAAHIGRSFQATSGAVERLQAAGVVRQISLGRRNRAFEVVGLFEAFTAFERLLASPEGDTRVAPPGRPVSSRPAPVPPPPPRT